MQPKQRNTMTQVVHAIKARSLFKSLGGRVAAGFLRNRGYDFDEVIAMLGLPKRG